MDEGRKTRVILHTESSIFRDTLETFDTISPTLINKVICVFLLLQASGEISPQ